MSAQQPEQEGHSVIRLGDETAVVVPLDEYRRFKALERHASPDDLEMADAEAAMAEYREWTRRDGPARSRTRSSWPSCLATPGEGQLVAGRSGIRPPVPFRPGRDARGKRRGRLAGRRPGAARGEYHRPRVGPYRIMYMVEEDLVTVIRVDRLPQPPA
jgi:hypothetical protein